MSKATHLAQAQPNFPRTKNLVKEYSEVKFDKNTGRAKETGCAKGQYVYSFSKRNLGQKKLWLNKGTMLESFLHEIYVGEVPVFDFISALENLVYTLSTLHKVKLDKDLAAINKIIEDLNREIGKSPHKANFDPLFRSAMDAVDKIFPVIEEVMLREKLTEALCGEVNRLVTQREETPKTRILHDSRNDKLYIQSKFLTKSVDLLEFSMGLLDKENKEPRIEKPIKGLYESIIIRLFLGDNLTDIKLANMLIVDRGDHYQVENIDFGNALTANYSHFILEEFTSVDLLLKIKGMSEQMDRNELQIFNMLFKAADPSEIKPTMDKIANLKDEDLSAIVANLSAVKDNNKEELVSKQLQDQYLENFQERREVFAAACRKGERPAVKTKCVSGASVVTIHTNSRV